MYRRTHMTKYTESKKKQLAKTRAFFKVCRKFIPRLKKYSKRMKYIGIGKTANSKHFASGLPQDKSVLKHFSIQPYTNVMADKFIFFLGEYHVNDAHAKSYNKELLRLFKELNKTKGVPHVHFFTELGIYEDPKQNNMYFSPHDVFTYLYKQIHKHRLSRIRIHKVDIRFTNMTLHVFLQMRDALFNRLLDLHRIHELTKKILTLLDAKNIKTKHHIVYNQYKKSKRLELLLPVFNSFFYRYFYEVKEFEDRLKKHIQHQKNNDIYKDYYLHVNGGFFLIQTFFMDFYSIGRILNPKYKYCVFLGGCAHTKSIATTMHNMNFLKFQKIYDECEKF